MARITAELLHPKTKEDLGPKVKAHTRYHLANGDQVPGVTTIVNELGWNKHTLINWTRNECFAGNDPNLIRDEMAAVGKLAHHFIECSLTGNEQKADDYSENQIDKALHAWKAFHDWKAKHTVNAQLVEAQLVSELHGFGGTIDLWGDLDGVPTLVDYKTSSGIWPEHTVQVGGGYWRLCKENDYEVKRILILHLPRTDDESFQEHEVTGPQVVHRWKVFQHAHALWRLHKQMR
jgi:hypothetical protein